MNDGKRQELKFTVGSDAEAHELTAAWREIMTGKLPRLNSAAADEDAIMERARIGLQRIVKAIEDHPGSGQSARLVKFLAGMYNGRNRVGMASISGVSIARSFVTRRHCRGMEGINDGTNGNGH